MRWQIALRFPFLPIWKKSEQIGALGPTMKLVCINAKYAVTHANTSIVLIHPPANKQEDKSEKRSTQKSANPRHSFKRMIFPWKIVHNFILFVCMLIHPVGETQRTALNWKRMFFCANEEKPTTHYVIHFKQSFFTVLSLFHYHLIWVCYLKKNMHYEKINAVAAGLSLPPCLFSPTLCTCLMISWARITSNGETVHIHRKM